MTVCRSAGTKLNGLGLRLLNQVIAIIDKVHWKNLLQKVWDYLDNHIGIYLLMYENELDNH